MIVTEDLKTAPALSPVPSSGAANLVEPQLAGLTVRGDEPQTNLAVASAEIATDDADLTVASAPQRSQTLHAFCPEDIISQLSESRQRTEQVLANLRVHNVVVHIDTVCSHGERASGDFFLAEMLNDNKVLFAVGDAEGKGMVAAAVALTVQQLIRDPENLALCAKGDAAQAMIALSNKFSLAYDALDAQHKRQGKDPGPPQILPVALAIFDVSSRELDLVSAGFPFIAIGKKDGDVHAIADGCRVLIQGLALSVEDVPVTRYKLGEGARIIIMSDGFSDRLIHAAPEMFVGLAARHDHQLLNTVINNSHQDPKALGGDFKSKTYAPHGDGADDATLIVMEV